MKKSYVKLIKDMQLPTIKTFYASFLQRLKTIFVLHKKLLNAPSVTDLSIIIIIVMLASLMSLIMMLSALRSAMVKKRAQYFGNVIRLLKILGIPSLNFLMLKLLMIYYLQNLVFIIIDSYSNFCRRARRK